MSDDEQQPSERKPGPLRDTTPEELTDAQLLERAALETPSAPVRTCTTLERRFIDVLLGAAAGDAGKAAKLVGWHSATGAQVLARPWVQAEIARQAELVRSRVGSVELDKERLLLELDQALLEAKTAFSRTTYVTPLCKRCGGTEVVCKNCEARLGKIEVQATPKEIASLAIAVARNVETAARIVGALAPMKVEHAGKTPVQDTYATLVRMVEQNTAAFTPAHRDEMIAAARRDRADIDRLLALLEVPEVAH